MKIVYRLFVLAALSAAYVLPAAQALTPAEQRKCRALAASLQVRQTEARDMTAERDGIAEAVELAGDEWEAAEAVRNFGAAQAAEADAKKQAYEAQKNLLRRKEMALQSAVRMLNSDAYDYNQQCQTD